MNSRAMRIGDAARYLGMSKGGVNLAVEAGRIPCTFSGGGHRIFDAADLDAYLGRPPKIGDTPRIEALYCRVSGSTGQEASLENQEAELRETATAEVVRVYKDRASGLRESRKGLDRMLDDARDGKFTVLRVTHRDRLARFGTAWLERLLDAYGVKVEVLHAAHDSSLAEELMQDFMSLIASFSGRFYQLRSRENQRRLLADAEERLAE